MPALSLCHPPCTDSYSTFLYSQDNCVSMGSAACAGTRVVPLYMLQMAAQSLR